MTTQKNTFNYVCEHTFDGIYDSRFNLEEQCSGYHQLKYLFDTKTNPATKEEMERWEENPTLEELLIAPEQKYLRNIHPNLRTFVIENWDLIKDLQYV